MARIRSIKPEFWEDEEIATLSPIARLLYIATWNMADDEGLLRWAAPYIKSNAFMYDDDIGVNDVGDLMAELTDHSFVIPYKGGKALQLLGWIPSFPRHQKPNRPQPSKLPAPSLQNPAIREAYAERDKWNCGICGEYIPSGPEFAYGPYSLDGRPQKDTHGLSLDHIVPKVAGGSDYPSNIRATHRACNSSKGGGSDRSLSNSLNGSQRITAGLTAVGEGSGVVGPLEPVDISVIKDAVKDGKAAIASRKERTA